MAKKTLIKFNKINKCKICTKEFQAKNFNNIICSDKCRTIYQDIKNLTNRLFDEDLFNKFKIFKYLNQDNKIKILTATINYNKKINRLLKDQFKYEQ